MIKRPLFCLLAAFCLGIFLKNRLLTASILTALAYILPGIILLVFPQLLKGLFRRDRFVVLLPLFFVLGAGLCSMKARELQIDSTFALTKSGKAAGTATGRVKSIAETSNGYKLIIDKCTVTIDNRSYREGNLLAYLDDVSGIRIGNKVALSGSLRELSAAENPGQFDEKSYYRAKQVACKMYVERLQVTENTCNYIRETARVIREKLASVYNMLLPQEEAGTLKAVILGDKSTLSEDTGELYRTNGIGHILAISGLHVSLIGNGLFYIIRRMSLPLIPAVAITEFLVIGYGFLTDFSISTIRAVFMLSVSLLAKLLGRSYDSREACSLCALLILAVNPLLLFQSAFILSFATALGIGAFNAEFKKWTKKQPDNFKIKTIRGALSGLAPQLITIPIILNTYYEIPTYSFLLNLIVLPGLTFVIVLGAAAGIIGLIAISVPNIFCSGFILYTARFFTGGAYYLLRLYKLLCRLMLRLPKPVLLFGAPEKWRLVLYYMVLMLFFLAAALLGRKHPKKPENRAYALLVLMLLPLIFIRVNRPMLRLTCLSVGQGDCAVISLEDGATVIIDCGSSNLSGISKYRLEPYLKYNGISAIEAIFVTHPDKDHISGIAELLERQRQSGKEGYNGSIKVKRLIMTQNAYASEKTDELRRLAVENNTEIVLFMAGDVLESNGLSIICLSPDIKHDNADNDGSIVLYVKYGTFDGLFMGDSSKAGEAASMTAVYNGLIEAPVDFLKVSHHGSKSASSAEFLQLLHPRIAVISYGRGNIYGHPNAAVVNRLEDIDALIYKTGASGAAGFVIRRN